MHSVFSRCRFIFDEKILGIQKFVDLIYGIGIHFSQK